MVRITVTKHNDERLEVVEYDILAWLSWPFDLLLVGCQKLIATVELMAKGSCVAASQEWCKEFYIPSGEVRNPARHQVVKGALLPPCCRKWRYEARSDYVSAVVDGVGSSIVCRGKTTRRHRNGR